MRVLTSKRKKNKSRRSKEEGSPDKIQDTITASIAASMLKLVLL